MRKTVMKEKKSKLTLKQKTFVDEYLIDCNATQAAIRAGYSPKTANRTASENLSKPDIQQAIEVAKQERSERTKIDADFVLQQIAEFLDCSFGRKPIKKVVNIDGDLFSVEIAEFNQSGVGKAIELMGKHINVQALKEKHEIDSTVNESFDARYKNMSEEEIDARIEELSTKMGYQKIKKTRAIT
jgi:phage terminase small subunit